MCKFQRSLLTAALVCACSWAFAQPGDAAAPLTRDEVKAELARAIASGEFAARHDRAGDGMPAVFAPRAADGGLSRAEVRAELMRAIASGELAAWRDRSGESGGPAVERMPPAGALTRGEVMAEYRRARASGELALQVALLGH